MITLYHNDMSTCSQKIRLALAEKKQDWSSQHLNLRAGDQFAKSYLEMNPRGVVPTLIHNRRILRESSVILEYLEDVFPAPRLLSTDPLERAHTRLWTKQFDEDLQHSTAIVSLCIAFRHQFLRKNSKEMSAYLAMLPTPSRRESLMNLINAGTDAPQFATAIKRYDRLFTEMEKQLSKSKWLVGNAFSLADLSYIPYFTRFEHLKLLRLLNRRPNVREWYRQVKSRQSYTKAIADWENVDYLDVFDRNAPKEWARVADILQVREDSGSDMP